MNPENTVPTRTITTLTFEIRRDGEPTRTERLQLEAIKIGNHPKAELFIDDREVSRVHAAIEVVGGNVFVTDLGSGRGTFVNGERINRRQLQHCDRMRVGSTDIVVGIHRTVVAQPVHVPLDPAAEARSEVLRAEAELAVARDAVIAREERVAQAKRELKKLAAGAEGAAACDRWAKVLEAAGFSYEHTVEENGSHGPIIKQIRHFYLAEMPGGVRALRAGLVWTVYSGRDPELSLILQSQPRPVLPVATELDAAGDPDPAVLWNLVNRALAAMDEFAAATQGLLRETRQAATAVDSWRREKQGLPNAWAPTQHVAQSGESTNSPGAAEADALPTEVGHVS